MTIRGMFVFSLIALASVWFFHMVYGNNKVDNHMTGNLTCGVGIKFYSANGVMKDDYFIESGTNRKVLPLKGNCFFVSR